MNLPFIDALRGIAILGVIWFHCHLHHYSQTEFYSLMDLLGSPAGMGVQLFYALSAFTLFLSMGQTPKASYSILNFYIRRFFRIAPLYYVAMGYYLLEQAYAHNQSLTSIITENTSVIIANTFMVHGLSPVWINSIIPGGWSVGIEVLFYALLPYLYRTITTLNRAVCFTAITLLVGYIFTALLHQIPTIQSTDLLTHYLFFYLPYQLPVFGCGIIAYYVVIRKDKRLSRKTVYLTIAAISLLILSKTVGKLYIPNLPRTIHFWGSIGFIFLIISLAKSPVGLLVNPVTNYIGKVSYSAYLIHFGVLFWMDKVLPEQLIPVQNTLTNVINFNLKFIVVVFVTTLISTITYHFIEERGRQFGNRLLRRQPLSVSKQAEVYA